MRLTDSFHTQGDFLFRWRGLIPLLAVPPLAGALTASGQFDLWFGEATEEAWDLFCVILAFAGLGIRVATAGCAPAGTSGRNTASQRAAALNTTGIYSIVRNPLYLGNCVIYLAAILSVKVWWLAFVIVPLIVLYYERIIVAEEAFLDRTYGDTYRAWVARTPAFFPNLSRWTPPALPLSWRNALRREYNGFYGIVFALTAIEALTDMVGESKTFTEWTHEDPQWVAFFLAGTVIWLAVRTIKKRTGWLRVEGR